MNHNLQEIHERGFTVIKDALPKDQIVNTLAAYQKVCNQFDSERLKSLKPNGRNSRLVNSHLASVEIATLFLNTRLLGICDAFFGGRKTCIYTSLFFQEGTKQPLHRDAPVFCTLPESLFLGCWFALEDSRIENGALVGVPGSHQVFHDEYLTRYNIGQERLREVDSIEFSDSILWNRYQSYVKGKCDELGLYPEPIEVNAGDIVVWHPLFLHGGLPHTSSSTRHSIVMHVIPEATEVHGSYLFFSPFKSFKPRTMEFTDISGSDRKMKSDVVCFSADQQ